MTAANTEMLHVRPDAPDPDTICRAARTLRQGGLVAFPTETVYGLGAHALDEAAVGRLFAAKGRPASNPVIVHVADVEAARQLVTDWPEAAEKLAKHFWPGPLTLVLPKRADVPDVVTAGGMTVAIRVPAHPIALALLKAAAIPIAAPSANLSERLSPTQAEHVREQLDGRIDFILDGGPAEGGVESTVVLLTEKYPRLLRPGLIAPSSIEEVIGPLRRRAPASATEAPAASPGQMPRHYAPRAPMEIGNGLRVNALMWQGEKVGWLTFYEGEYTRHKGDRLVWRLMPREPKEYAATLYAALHELDAQGVTRIVIDVLPETEPWLAINDRVRRAVTPVEEPGNSENAGEAASE